MVYYRKYQSGEQTGAFDLWKEAISAAGFFNFWFHATCCCACFCVVVFEQVICWQSLAHFCGCAHKSESTTTKKLKEEDRRKKANQRKRRRNSKLSFCAACDWLRKINFQFPAWGRKLTEFSVNPASWLAGTFSQIPTCGFLKSRGPSRGRRKRAAIVTATQELKGATPEWRKKHKTNTTNTSK